MDIHNQNIFLLHLQISFEFNGTSGYTLLWFKENVGVFGIIIENLQSMLKRRRLLKNPDYILLYPSRNFVGRQLKGCLILF